MAEAVAALWNRYSICAAAGVPGARSLAISLGSTQPPAELLTEAAMPTMVSTGLPGRLVMVSRVPSGMEKFEPGLGSLDRTTWPGRCAQCPDCRVRSSSGPPGEARPTSVVGGKVTSPPPDPSACAFGVTVTSPNGPAAAVTPASRLVAARSAPV